jgi:hypothetical protein
MPFTQQELKLNHPFAISGDELVGQVIYEGIKCKDYPTLPRNADIIVAKVRDLYEREFERVSENFYLRYFASYTELHDWLWTHILPIPEIEELNLRQREYDSGLRAKDVHSMRPDFPRQGKYNKNEDFIDLSAFIRNLCHNLIKSCIGIDYSTF